MMVTEMEMVMMIKSITTMMTIWKWNKSQTSFHHARINSSGNLGAQYC